MSAYAQKLERLRGRLKQQGASAIGLAKTTSNLFRDSANRPRPAVDLSDFNEVIRVDPAAGVLECEAMATYADIVEASLAQGVMPCVVPELKSITAGGAAAGVGIESSSFRYGLMHETLSAIDVLLADGTLVTCTPGNEHSDLLFGFPNSYGTLGYALRLELKTVPVRPYVHLEHVRHTDSAAYFDDLAGRCGGDADFVDGTVFSPDEMYLTLGRFTDEAPWTSDYTFERIYYRSIREKTDDYLRVRDYIWRWDTDWFWCSKNVGAQNPLLRRLYGRHRLNSVTYARIMRWNSRVGLTRALTALSGSHPESVIQDIDIPVERAKEFLAFLLAEVGILPIWICPVRSHGPGPYALYPMDSRTLYVNFGFWDVVKDRVPRAEGFRNRKIEIEAQALGGIKSLYSASYFPETEFWSLYNGTAFRALKQRYDPDNALHDLYQKCVLGYRGARAG